MKKVGDGLKQLALNISQCADDIRELVEKRKKSGGENGLEIDLSKLNSLPGGFVEMSKVFNFYILEWTRRYKYLLSEYIRASLSGEDSGKYEQTARKIEKKITRLCGEKGVLREKVNSVKMMDAFDKFSSLYKIFISTDRHKRTGTDGAEYPTSENNYTIFSFRITSDNKNQLSLLDAAVKEAVLGDIVRYYDELKHTRYVQVAADLYQLNKGKNPLGFKGVPQIEEINNTTDIVVQVCVEDATALNLDIRFYPKRAADARYHSWTEMAEYSELSLTDYGFSLISEPSVIAQNLFKETKTQPKDTDK
jgi:hypothetical protein